MRGVVLCGGLGSRLAPATHATNKHLSLVYNKPMIFYPLATLMLAGIREITVVTHSRDLTSFRRLLGDGSQFGMEILYAHQDEPSGIVGGLHAALSKGNRASTLGVILGDNFFYGPGLGRQLAQITVDDSSTAFAIEVENPEQFGVVEFDSEGGIRRLIEKPQEPRSNWALSGLYLLGDGVLEAVDDVRPSDRGEREIVDLLEWYLRDSRLNVVRLPRSVMWADMGTPESLHDVASYVRLIERRQGQIVGGLEEIAWRNGWISKEELETAMGSLAGTSYVNAMRLSLSRDV